MSDRVWNALGDVYFMPSQSQRLKLSEGDKLYSISEFARIQGISRSTAYRWINQGLVTAHYVSGTRCRRIPKSEIERINRVLPTIATTGQAVA